MSTTSRLDHSIQDGIAYFEYVGDVTLEMVVESIARVAADPDFRPGMPILVDFRRFEGMFSLEQIRAFRAHVARLHAGGGPRRAAYVSDDPMYKLTVRLHETAIEFDHVADPVTMRSFSSATYRDALAWLGGKITGP